MPRRPSWKELRTGLIALAGLVVVALGILVFARVGALHGRTFRLYARTPNARGVIRGEYGRTSDFFYDAGNREGEDFALANFRVGVEGRRWGAFVWVRNAFDEEYVPIALQVDPTNENFFVGESGAPRTVGVTLSLNI